MKSTMEILIEDPTEVSARAVLWSAANYIYANQLGDPSRILAMDLLDAIRRNWNAPQSHTMAALEASGWPRY